MSSTTSPKHPNRTMFLNLPVEDLDASVAFFTKLGFTFNPSFTDETATCMLIGEQAFCMLLTREKYTEFSKLPLANPRTHSIGLFCFGVDSREQVDTITDAAVAAGGEDHDDAQDYGFMYSRSFFDLDGHGWQVFWMDPAAAELGPEEYMRRQQEVHA